MSHSLALNPFEHQLADGTLHHPSIRRTLLDHAAARDLAAMPKCAAVAVALANAPIPLPASTSDGWDPWLVLARIQADGLADLRQVETDTRLAA